MKKCNLFVLVFLAAVLPIRLAIADNVDLNFSAITSAEDYGPQDGIYDEISALGLGTVVDNGFTSWRTAFDFDLTSIPNGATVTSANLTIRISVWEGIRSIQLHGYEDDGTIQLADFSIDGLISSQTIGVVVGSQEISFDVTEFISAMKVVDAVYAGFGLREGERPPNSPNYTVMRLETVTQGYYPLLSVEYSSETVVQIDIKPGVEPNSLNLCSQGVLPVAVLSDTNFDATTIVPSSVRLADSTVKMAGNSEQLLCHSDYVNSDDQLDMVCQVVVTDLALEPGVTETQATLRAQTDNGASVVGSDSLNVVKNCQLHIPAHCEH